MLLLITSKPRPFPDRYLFLQFIYDPLDGSKPFAAMRTCYGHDKRWFSSRDKSNSMVNGNELKSKVVCSLFRNSFQLVLRHFTMCFVLDSINFASAFKPPHHSPKLDHRSRIAIKAFRQALEWRFSYQNFTNDICHEIQTLVTVLLN